MPFKLKLEDLKEPSREPCGEKKNLCRGSQMQHGVCAKEARAVVCRGSGLGVESGRGAGAECTIGRGVDMFLSCKVT